MCWNALAELLEPITEGAQQGMDMIFTTPEMVLAILPEVAAMASYNQLKNISRIANEWKNARYPRTEERDRFRDRQHGAQAFKGCSVE